MGATIKFIDGFDLVRPLCQETIVDLEGLARHKRRQKIAKYKEKLQHASVTPTSASSRLDVNAPLLASGMTTAALALHAPQPGRNIVPIAGALTLVGASLMVGYQFLLSSQEVANNNGLILTDNERDVPLGSVSYGNRPPALDLHLNSTANSTCYDVVAKIRKLLHSSQSGIRLADEFSQFIFDENIDLRVKHAEKLITTMNVTEFTCQDREQMNNLLIDIFSVLLTPPGSRHVLNMAKLINVVNMKVSKIWRDNANGTENDSIGKAIQGLHSYILRAMVNALQTTQSEKLERIIKFVINFPAPDFIQFLNHGLSNESVISKSLNDYWIDMGVEYPKNKYIKFGDFKSALDRGELLTFRLARVKVYLGDSENSTEVNKYQKYNRVINKPYQDYHELDINLERTKPVSARDVARSKYEILGVDIDKESDFERPTFKIHRTPLRKPEYPIIIECKDLFCVIMSFPDGIKVLYDLMPNSVPGPLRKYPYEGKTAFSLKPHPLRTEIKSDYEELYKTFEDEHINYYQQVITKAFNITTADVKSYLSDQNMVYSLVDGHSKRFQMVRYLFIQAASKLNPEVLSNAAFNERIKTEGGVIFFGENIKTWKRKYFLLNPEIARKGQLFPIIILPINTTRDIQTLQEEILNQHYFFKDGGTYWDRCETVEKPRSGWTDDANNFFKFYSGWTKYVLSKGCEFITPSWQIIPWFEEKQQGPAATAIPLIIERALENRRAFLSWQKQKVDEATLTQGEKEAQLGALGIIVEKFPLKSCADSVNNLLLKSVDDLPIDHYENLLRFLSCGVELLLPRSVFKILKGLGRAISKVNMQKLSILAKKKVLDSSYKLAQTLPHSSKQHVSSLIESQITSEIAQLKAAKAMLKQLEQERFIKLLEAVSIFPGYMYPLTNLKPFGTNLFSLVEALKGKGFAGFFTLAKRELIDFYQQHKFHPFSRWIAPQGNRSLEIENYMFPLPAGGAIHCYNDTVEVSNLTINIFEIHQKDPGLYKELLFSELKSGSIEQVIDAAKAGGWTIAADYDPLAMFAFRSFTPELRKYVMQVLDLGNYYNLNPNRTDIDANFFYDYLKENFDKAKPTTIRNLILTPEQNILLAHARQNIKDIMTSNSCAFENNYRFVLQYVLVSKTQEVLTQLSDVTTRERIVRMLLPEVFYYLQRFTVNTKKSIAQENYHVEVINFLASRIKYKLAENPATITLYCENLSYFNDNVDDYAKKILMHKCLRCRSIFLSPF
ncbi:hypothetical protein [Pantoea sp. AS-PWVM4]|uniref:hypothetical protein n=1 Tax=Pantoea sp. AS-PWVM4 TaxID=1332069 RepID=UPI0012687DDC|nr:hypothetical protein [Pantoea sp. AS-PWVM4]